MRAASFLVLALAWLSGAPALEAFTNPAEGVFRSDGTAEDTQAALSAAPNGSMVEIPAGNFVWKRPVRTQGKAVHLRGAGGGAILGHSATKCPIGPGIAELQVSYSPGELGRISHGDVVRIVYMPHGADRWMEGTVKACEAGNLAIEVSSCSGEGTYDFWCITAPGKTVIRNEIPRGAAIELSPTPSGLVEISNLHFQAGDGNTWATNHLSILDRRGGKGFRIHHSRFTTNGEIGRAIEVRTLGGLIDHCSFDQGFDAGPGNGIGNDDQAVGFKAESAYASWRTASTMGTLDIDGTANTYVEDCYFAGFWTQCLDFDDNSRTVVRHCVFNHSGCASHGADTSAAGNRHFELYDNEFLFRDAGADTFNVTWWLFVRGGTGVITGNVLPDLRSQSWGDKAELNFTVMNLRRKAGRHPCWRSGWPVPHQIGQGHDGKKPVSEPVYIWGNSGGGEEIPFLSDYEPNECGEGAAPVSEYLQPDRDFVVGEAKPGYVKFRYPHPLRGRGES